MYVLITYASNGSLERGISVIHKNNSSLSDMKIVKWEAPWIFKKGQRKGQNMEPIRLNKYLSEQGVCSRREADRLIEAGKVTIDGRRAGMGEKVTGKETIICDGKTVGQGAGEKKVKPVLLAVNKPRGVVCTTSDKDRAMNVVELIHYPARVYPVGRLDKDSEGLLLMTNQGDLANEIMHAGNFHEKEYIVTVDQPFNSAFIKKMQEGVELKELQVTTRPCKVKALGKKTFQITLTQGLNRQIRRMCEALGYHVVTLKRVRIMNIHLGRLNTGDYRRVTPQELEELQWQLEQARMEREEEES